jgi:hypothetical protein
MLATLAGPLLSESALDRLQSAAEKLSVEGEPFWRRQRPFSPTRLQPPHDLLGIGQLVCIRLLAELGGMARQPPFASGWPLHGVRPAEVRTWGLTQSRNEPCSHEGCRRRHPIAAQGGGRLVDNHHRSRSPRAVSCGAGARRFRTDRLPGPCARRPPRVGSGARERQRDMRSGAIDTAETMTVHSNPKKSFRPSTTSASYGWRDWSRPAATLRHTLVHYSLSTTKPARYRFAAARCTDHHVDQRDVELLTGGRRSWRL